MPTPRFRHTLTVIATAMGLAGCETVFPIDPQEWRSATVRQVMHLSELPPLVDRRCTQLPEDPQHQERLDARVALVAYRTGHFQHLHAFELSDDQMPTAGDQVIVQPLACHIKIGSAGPARTL